MQTISQQGQSKTFIRWIFICTMFLSAFLLFQIQPIVGKAIIPWFGGSPSVWVITMFFFQFLLIFGYAYAHCLRNYSVPAWSTFCILLALSAVLLPILPEEHWKYGANDNPAQWILLLLLANVGLPYVLLATTSPLLQVWWSRVFPGSPYRLYALSNAGSLLALLSYPFVVEPLLPLALQDAVWSVGFLLYALLMVIAWCAQRICSPSNLNEQKSREPAMPVPIADSVHWLSMTFLGSVLLLAVTNHLTQDIASVPFLWVMPLSLYLLSFILCFDHWKPAYRSISALISFFLALYITFEFPAVREIISSIVLNLAFLFAGCMLCHGELVRRKPTANNLTKFYVTIAMGGALGGMFVSLLAPLLFNDYHEFPLSLIAVCFLALFVFYDERTRMPLKIVAREAGWFIVIATLLSVISATVRFRMLYEERILTTRNFHGVISILERDKGNPAIHRLQMHHGTTIHGEQFIHPSLNRTPTTYYAEQSGIGLALRSLQDKTEKRIGLIGLGIGTLASYGNKEDTFRFYEINPEVVRLARSAFTYLQNTPANIEIILGDGRLSLESEHDQEFDLLALDAFTSDAIPTHLLTEEAFALYLRHLAPQGILAMNVTNRHIDFIPVLQGMAQKYDLDILIASLRKTEGELYYSSDWVLMSPGDGIAGIRGNDGIIDPDPSAKKVLWTDDYSNIFGILKLK